MKKGALLIAEDDAVLRELYTKKFSLAGYAVHAVENGQLALDAFARVKPDVLLLDINMPVMDGLTVLERLGNERSCPAIMLTNLEDDASKERAKHSKVDGYFVKMHMTVGALVQMVEDAVASKRDSTSGGNRPGFMLFELLIVIGLMGILASVVIVAVNPAQHLQSAANGKRNAEAKGVRDAYYQYLLDHGSYPNAAQIPESAGNAKALCREGVTDASCVNADALVPEYLVGLPVDPDEENPLHTGYEVYVSVGRVHVESTYLADSTSSSSSSSSDTSSSSSVVTSSSSSSATTSSSSAATTSSASSATSSSTSIATSTSSSSATSSSSSTTTSSSSSATSGGSSS